MKKTIISLLCLLAILVGAETMRDLTVKNLTVTSAAPNATPLIISTFPGLGNNVFEVLNSGGSVLAGVRNDGSFIANSGFTVSSTITAVAVTNYQTINKIAGRVNIGPGTNTVYVTNSTAAATSVLVGSVATGDATAAGLSLVPSSGLITIKLVTAPTAETAINWILFN